MLPLWTGLRPLYYFKVKCTRHLVSSPRGRPQMSPKDLVCARPLCVAGCPQTHSFPQGALEGRAGPTPRTLCLSGGEGKVWQEELSPFPGECGEASPPSLVFLSSCRLSPVFLSLPHTDDNSNQSSIADASPIKQENSSNSSPAPEPTSSVPGDGADTKADEAQAEGKELPGAEGTYPRGLGSGGPLCFQPPVWAGR